MVSLEELGNPNKLRMGVTNGPLNPDPTRPTGVSARRSPGATSRSTTSSTSAERGRRRRPWAFVASPEESTDATSVVGMCGKTQPNGTPNPGPASTAGTCSWASGQDVIRSGFLYKLADGRAGRAVRPRPPDARRHGVARRSTTPGSLWRSSSSRSATRTPTASRSSSTTSRPRATATRQPSATTRTAPWSAPSTATAPGRPRSCSSSPTQFADKWDTTKVFLVGDFNSYTGEDPVQAILIDPDPGTDDLDFGLVESDDPDDLTYVFTANVSINGGNVGYGARRLSRPCLRQRRRRGDDHRHRRLGDQLQRDGRLQLRPRSTTTTTDFCDATVPFGGSDHNPAIIGIDAGGAPSVRDIQIIGSNDFHGRLLGSTRTAARPSSAGAVKSLGDLRRRQHGVRRRRATSSAPRRSSRSYRTTSRPWRRSTPRAWRSRPWATTSSTRATTTCSTGS